MIKVVKQQFLAWLRTPYFTMWDLLIIVEIPAVLFVLSQTPKSL